jgi:Bacterial membrane protein YfhO
MTKTKKTVQSKKSKPEGFFAKFNIEEILPQKYHVLAVILIIIILFLGFLNPLFFGNKTFQSGDIAAVKSMDTYIENHTGDFTLWNPYLFCGMPAYAIRTSAKLFNLFHIGITAVRDAFSAPFSNGYVMWVFYLVIMGITSYFLMKHLTQSFMVSLFTAITTSFSTGLIVFLFIGHVTKLTALAFYPLIFLLLLRSKEKIRIIDFLLMIITLQLFIQGFHVQIVYYTVLAVGIYFIYYFISSIIKKEFELRNNILKSAALFAVAIVIAFLIQADSFTQVYEYSQFSTRGTESIVDKVSGKEQENTSDYYDYHTSWSFSPGEVLTFIVPSYYGFGNSTYNGPLTNNRPVDVNTYFGQMPFVDVAMYMGVLVFFLALFGIFTSWEKPFVRFLTIVSVFALLVSFGKNFPLIFDPLFNYLPFFNKFRVPSMILVLDQMSFPILAGFGLMKIISLRTEKNIKLEKLIKNAAFIFTGIFVLGILLNGAISTWFISRVNDYAANISSSQSQMAKQYQALAEYMSGMFLNDFLFAFAFLSLTFWAANFYIKEKISKDSLVMIVIVLSLIDLWRIDARGAKYLPTPNLENEFQKPEYVKVIQEQNDKNPFRILNLKQDHSLGSFSQNSNFDAYFLIEDFYGYSAVKPRAFQDFMDVVGPVNSTLWRMANVKYIVTDKPAQFPGLVPIYKGDKEVVYLNQFALPRMYFVDSVANEPEMSILQDIKASSFDPKEKAYVSETGLKVDPADSSTFVNITGYKDETITAEVKASGNNFLFLGDTYMTGKADYKLVKLPTGWRAYIDNNETKIYKANHGYMGIIVPAGQHKVEFKYAPESFYISKNIALILSSLVVLGLIIILVKDKKKIFGKE